MAVKYYCINWGLVSISLQYHDEKSIVSASIVNNLLIFYSNNNYDFLDAVPGILYTVYRCRILFS
jgi:hypothetical protein